MTNLAHAHFEEIMSVHFDEKNRVLDGNVHKVGHLRYDARLHIWNLQAAFSRGVWATLLSDCGLANTNVPSPGIEVPVPIDLIVGSQTFSDEITVSYRAKANVQGFAQ